MFEVNSNRDHPAGCNIHESITRMFGEVERRKEECNYSFNGIQVIVSPEDDDHWSVFERWEAGMKAAAEKAQAERQQNG